MQYHAGAVVMRFTSPLAKDFLPKACRIQNKSRKMVGLPKDSPTDNRTDPSAAEGSKYRLMLATLEPLLRLMENETSNPPALHLMQSSPPRATHGLKN